MKWDIDDHMVMGGVVVARKLLTGRVMTLDGFMEAMVPCNPGETQAVIERLGLKIFKKKRIKYVSLP